MTDSSPRMLLPLIALGGALGSLLRWGLASALAHPPGGFAWSTLISNVVGAFALAVLMVASDARWPDRPSLRPFLGVGVLGGFTTFSTWMLDAHASWLDSPFTSITYVALTLVGGLLATVAGVALTRRLLGVAPGRP